MSTLANPDFARRGAICRDLRHDGPARYRSQAAVAAYLGILTSEVAAMEAGRADPARLEQFWGVEFATAGGSTAAEIAERRREGGV